MTQSTLSNDTSTTTTRPVGERRVSTETKSATKTTEMIARIIEVIVVPRVRIFSTDAMQVRSGAFRSPGERMIVNEFASLGVFAVTLGFRSKRANHFPNSIRNTSRLIRRRAGVRLVVGMAVFMTGC